MIVVAVSQPSLRSGGNACAFAELVKSDAASAAAAETTEVTVREPRERSRDERNTAAIIFGAG